MARDLARRQLQAIALVSNAGGEVVCGPERKAHFRAISAAIPEAPALIAETSTENCRRVCGKRQIPVVKAKVAGADAETAKAEGLVQSFKIEGSAPGNTSAVVQLYLHLQLTNAGEQTVVVVRDVLQA